MEKPYRFLLDRVASYAEEGGAFLRRRRLRSRPFGRIWSEGGRIDAIDPADERHKRLFEAASELLGPASSSE
jgi:hypothetical protein